MVTRTGASDAGTGAAVPRMPACSPQLFVCAECMYAQLFAMQPRALCTRRGSPFEGLVLFAGQPACTRIVPRKSLEPVLAWCSTDVRHRHQGPGQAPSG
jgi:hypothetical protein